MRRGVSFIFVIAIVIGGVYRSVTKNVARGGDDVAEAEGMRALQGQWSSPATDRFAAASVLVTGRYVRVVVDAPGDKNHETFYCVKALPRGVMGCQSHLAKKREYDMEIGVKPDGTMTTSALAELVFTRDTSAAAQAPSAAGGSAPQVDESRDWRASSDDGAVVVTQSSAGSGCVLEARRGDDVLWKSSTCAGTKLDYKFVSPDGTRLAVLYPLPTIERTVRSSTVMRMFKRGVQQYAAAAASTAADWSKLKTGGTHFYWLAGALDAPGEPPRYSDSGKAFDFATTDGKKHHVALTE